MRHLIWQVFRLAINHMEDVYAYDLAFKIIGDGRAGAFFSKWVHDSSRARPSRWETISNEVTVAFVLGNMERHGIVPDELVTRRAQDFAVKNRLRRFSEMVSDFGDLPLTDEADKVENAVLGLLTRIIREGTNA